MNKRLNEQIKHKGFYVCIFIRCSFISNTLLIFEMETFKGLWNLDLVSFLKNMATSEIFVNIRKHRTVAGRLTEFSSSSTNSS